MSDVSPAVQRAIEARAQAVLQEIDAALGAVRARISAECKAEIDATFKNLAYRIANVEARFNLTVARLDEQLSASERALRGARYDAAQSMVVEAMNRPEFLDALAATLRARQPARRRTTK